MMQEFQEKLEVALKLVKLTPQELGMVVIMNWGKWVSPPASGVSFEIPKWFKALRYLNDAVSVRDCLALAKFAKWLGGFNLETRPTFGEDFRDIAFKILHKNVLMREGSFRGTMEGAGDLVHQILTLWANAHGVILFEGKVIKQKTA